MAAKPQRDDFKAQTKATLGKRSGFQCAICQATTIGPSAETPMSVTNIGVAAHIAAAAPGGPRYDALMSSKDRSAVTNGIWLCQNHAKLIDTDTKTWTVSKLHQIKKDHEGNVTKMLGIPLGAVATPSHIPDYEQLLSITPREYGFIPVGSLRAPYKDLLTPMLKDKELGDEHELGVLMCGSPPEDHDKLHRETPWTVFVKADWLKWCLESQQKGYKTALEVPPEQIYGRIPAWPDSFFDFLTAIVQTNTTLAWQRDSDGYLVLGQLPTGYLEKSDGIIP